MTLKAFLKATGWGCYLVGHMLQNKLQVLRQFMQNATISQDDGKMTHHSTVMHGKIRAPTMAARVSITGYKQFKQFC